VKIFNNKKFLGYNKDKENNTVETNVNKKTLTIASQEVHHKHLNEKKKKGGQILQQFW
jgi:hypothetical protein